MALRNLLTLTLIALALPAAADRLALFDEAAAFVESQFYDPRMNGLDWLEVTAEHRARISPEMDREAFAGEVNDMLARLEASHTMLLTRDVPRWYQLAGIFAEDYPPLRQALEKVVGGAFSVYTGIGVTTETDASGAVVTGVLHGFPAESAGVLIGDRILTVEDQPFHPILSFAGRDGRSTRMRLERTPGQILELTVVPTLIDGRTMFETAMRKSAKVIEVGSARIGYIRAWSYAGQKYQDILAHELINGSLEDSDALVLDLRGGWGGASPRYLNLFADESLEAQSIGRSGEVNVFASGWTRPTVLLIDEHSRSGKELFAYGFRALGKGTIVGEPSAGEVLSGRINALSDGSLLYVATADVRIGQERLEGQGVVPDVLVPFDPLYAAGADPQLDRAIEVTLNLITRQSHRRGDPGADRGRPGRHRPPDSAPGAP